MNKTLVAYFSATGTTAAIAKEIADLAHADVFQIIPVKPYSAADLNWNDKQSRSSLEMSDPASRPAIAEKVSDMSEYKTVFLGFPIWWYEAPKIIRTFLENYDFTGKVMIPFVTSGGSGLGRIPEILQKICPDANWQHGKRLAEGTGKKELENWLEEYTGWKQ